MRREVAARLVLRFFDGRSDRKLRQELVKQRDMTRRDEKGRVVSELKLKEEKRDRSTPAIRGNDTRI